MDPNWLRDCYYRFEVKDDSRALSQHIVSQRLRNPQEGLPRGRFDDHADDRRGAQAEEGEGGGSNVAADVQALKDAIAG